MSFVLIRIFEEGVLKRRCVWMNLNFVDVEELVRQGVVSLIV